MRAALALLACVGCGKELNPKFCAAHPDDERCTGSVADAAGDADGDAEGTFAVAHLPPAIEDMFTSDVDIILDDSSLAGVIDTSAGTITPAWPGAVILPDVAQDNGPNVMVVQVGSLDIPADVDFIDIDGNKPLIIVARRTITLGARLNVSADATTPGPGGFASAKGTGAGATGVHSGVNADGGGGGGSYATAGGVGGGPMGGAAGATYGSALTLSGGSGGGRPSSGTCTIEGGAGGGAIQLTALVSITIEGAATGRINAGGSGGYGGGGTSCGGSGTGGGGGGSGGMIFLESPLITGDGALGALGGGGGEGTSTGGSTPGEDGGEAATTSPGVGGTNSSSTGGDGGTGGAPGSDGEVEGNGGGGGGGAGYIFLRTTGPAPAALQINPPPTSA